MITRACLLIVFLACILGFSTPPVGRRGGAVALVALRVGRRIRCGWVRDPFPSGRCHSPRTCARRLGLTPGTASRFGLDVRTGTGQRTRIGCDTTTGEVYLDRTCSGATDFDPTFSSTEHALLALDGKPLHLHVLVDASSVEVYAGNARGEQVVLTDQVFPDLSSTGGGVFADNGTAKLTRLQAWRLASIWK